jgi:hypothetical protein
MNIREFIIGSAIDLALAALGLHCMTGCAKPPTAQQAGAVADATCTILDAFAGSSEEQAICATADDLIDLAATIRAYRSDAGPSRFVAKKSSNCRIVHTVCATDDELAFAIVAKKGGAK